MSLFFFLLVHFTHLCWKLWWNLSFCKKITGPEQLSHLPKAMIGDYRMNPDTQPVDGLSTASQSQSLMRTQWPRWICQESNHGPMRKANILFCFFYSLGRHKDPRIHTFWELAVQSHMRILPGMGTKDPSIQCLFKGRPPWLCWGSRKRPLLLACAPSLHRQRQFTLPTSLPDVARNPPSLSFPAAWQATAVPSPLAPIQYEAMC